MKTLADEQTQDLEDIYRDRIKADGDESDGEDADDEA